MYRTQLFCVLVCLLTLAEQAAAFSTGPPANRNGVGGVYCTACHRTNELNTGEGSVRIFGLPAGWTPGETLALSVIVSHPTAVRAGFQVSVTGLAGDQAGTLVVGADGRTASQTASVNGKSVQFVNHNATGATIGSPKVFQFSYTAPADASFGAIRFHVAGNAANGGTGNQGDFIYAIEVTVPVLSRSNNRLHTLSSKGAATGSTAGAGPALSAGFARMQATSNPAASGVGFLSYRHGSVLASETALLASAPIRTGRTYVEAGDTSNGGMAIANPSNQPANVGFYFTDATGANFGASSVTVQPNTQISAFLSEAPFRSGIPASRSLMEARTFTFFSNVPIAVASFRTRVNERGEFTLTSFPVEDLFVSSTAIVALPHIADGGGWSTEIVLVNTGDSSETGTLQFLSSAGQNLTVSLDGQSGNQFSYAVPPRSAQRLRTAGSAGTASTGWVQVSPTGGTQTPSVTGVLVSRVNGVRVSETAMAAVPAAAGFRLYAESAGDYTGRQGMAFQTGVAISNAGTTAVNVTAELTNAAGAVLATATLSIPARGQMGVVLNDVAALRPAAPFSGALSIVAPTGSAVSVSGLRSRYTDRSTSDLLLTSYPAVADGTVVPPELVFPQLVDGGGYATQLVTIGPGTGASTGATRFFTAAGQPLTLPIR